MKKNDPQSETNVYKNQLFGEPETFIRQIPSLISHGTVLDIGAGQGRHSLFFAKHGFNVTALDNDANWLGQLKEKSKQLKLPISIVQSSIEDFTIKKSYDIIICTLVLHLLSQDKAYTILQKMKAHTTPGGYNAIATFTNESEYFKSDPKIVSNFYPTYTDFSNSIYNGWDVIQSSQESVNKCNGQKAQLLFFLAQKK